MLQRVCVVGGGISGIVCARRLATQGVQVQCFDKGRAAGGRCATRHADDGSLVFNHGMQLFTARSDDFREEVRRWVEAGVARVFDGRLVDLDNTNARGRTDTDTVRYVGEPTASALSRHLAEGVTVENRHTVTKVDRGADGLFGIEFESPGAMGRSGGYDGLVLALPSAQAAALLPANDQFHQQASNVLMRPRWSAMFAFEEPLNVEFDAAVVRSGPLDWVMKMPGGLPQRWVAFGSPAFSREHVERNEDEMVGILLEAFAKELRLTGRTPSFQKAHRWRYAEAQRPLGEGALWDPTRNLGLCGDWLLGAKLEHAWLSGNAMADKILAGAAA